MKKRRLPITVVFISAPVLYVLWVLLVGTFSLHELLVGVLAMVLGVTGLGVIDLQYPARFAPRLSELLSIWRIAGPLVVETWIIWRVAALDFLGRRRAQSLFRVVPFHTGRKGDPHAVARRVLATTYTTIAPNSIVLGVNVGNHELLFHQIERSAVPKLIKQLGGRA